jgi:ankyrin repeat protein
MSLPLETVQAVHAATEELGFCRNRVWTIAKSLPGGAKKFPKLLPRRDTLSFKVSREDHELCTFDFCEQSRVNFTLMKQRHEKPCEEARCVPRIFHPDDVAEAVQNEQLVVWNFRASPEVLKLNERYMAISHVWSDGTGAGNQLPGHVNSCLLDFFRGFAQKFECEGLWWDTICIPMTKDLREKALKDMHQNYKTAAVTLVHDCFLRECKWIDADTACFYIVMSPWFSRGWTALELKMSHNVQVIFRGPDGPITKDLDKDILEAKSNDSTAPGYEVAREMLKRLRGKKVGQLNELLAILGSRHTSWPRDMAIISGLMIGIELPEAFAHQKIYQEILQELGELSHAHLFHNSATMTNGYNWCPTNIYDLPVTLPQKFLQIEKNGNLFGEWDIMPLDHIKDERFILSHAHPMIAAKVELARHEKDRHIVLIEPGSSPKGAGISRGLLVKPSVRGDEDHIECYCDYVGPVYFHPPLMISEVEVVAQIFSYNNVHIGRNENIHNDSNQSIKTEEKVQSMIERMKIGSSNTQPQKRPKASRDFGLDEYDQTKMEEELIKAAKAGVYEKVEILLKKVNNPNKTDTSGWSALHHAVWNDKPEVVNLLVKRLPLKQRTTRGEEPLHLAAVRGNEQLVIMLLEGSTLGLKREEDGLNALHLAARSGFVGIVDKILQENWAINATDNRKQTALHMASFQGYEDVVNILTKHGADHALKDSKEETALSLAVFRGHKKTAKVLIEAGADLNGRYKYRLTLIHQAAFFGHVEAIETLVHLEADIKARDKHGQTPLHQAAYAGHVEAIKTLVHLEADIEARDKHGQTPLHKAIFKGHVEAIKTLVHLEADIEARDKDGQTPLHQAAYAGHVEAIETLVHLKADIKARDEDRSTALHKAASEGHVEAIKTLVDFKADIEARDKRGRTPLHKAVFKGHVGAIKTLVHLEADIEARDKRGQTPLHLAEFRHHVMAIEILSDPKTNSRYVQQP